MESKRNARRKNRKIKFSEDQYVETQYMSDGKAIIPLQLYKVSDLYMKHDYKQIELADSVCAYIEEIAYMIPINTDIVIEIHCPKVDILTQQRIVRSIRNNYGIEIDDVDYDMMLENRRSIILAVIGIILLIVNIITDKFIGDILSNFICVVWWVAIWDMIEIQTMDKAENKAKRLSYQQLYDAQITFVFDGE